MKVKPMIRKPEQDVEIAEADGVDIRYNSDRPTMDQENEMFICDTCKRVTSPCEKMTKKVVNTRPKQYKNGGIGWEIVKEIKVCTKCKGE